MTEWYVWDGRSKSGPMDRGELDRRIQAHPTPKVIRVWRQGVAEWSTVEEAFAGVGGTPPPLPAAQPAPASPPSPQIPQSLQSAPSPAKYHNFIAQNWRGEYSLGVTYWVIGLMSAVVAAVVPVAAGAFLSGLNSPFGVLTFFVLLWTFGALLTVWQLVGIWRSASRRISERAAIGRKAPWAGLAKVAVCLGGLQFAGHILGTAVPQLAEAGRIAFMDDPGLPPYTIHVMNEGTEVQISGGIKFGLADDLEKILDASRSVRVVHLDSLGGRVGEGQRLNGLIRTRRLDTYVGGQCMSACTLAFVAGNQRILKHGGRLGFHRGSFAGDDQADDRIERAIYAAAGLPSAFINRALATRNADMWLPTEAELLAAAVVTQMSDGDEYAIGGGAGTLSRETWDKTLQKVSPLYRNMKDKYPDTYDQILNEFVRGAVEGLPQGKLMAAARVKLSGLVSKLLPSTEDDVLFDYGRLILDQYRSIQQQDKAVCYRFTSGQPDESALRMIPLTLRDRELELDARLLASATKAYAPANNGRSWDRVIAGLASKGFSREDLELAQAGAVQPKDYGRYCDLSVALYQEVMALPRTEAVSLLRQMLAPS